MKLKNYVGIIFEFLTFKVRTFLENVMRRNFKITEFLKWFILQAFLYQPHHDPNDANFDNHERMKHFSQ